MTIDGRGKIDMADVPAHIERKLIAIAPDGSEHELVLRVDLPRFLPEGYWAATVSMGILEASQYEANGVDSWQAMQQAMLHASQMLAHHQRRGWQCLWERGGDEASPLDLITAPADFDRIVRF